MLRMSKEERADAWKLKIISPRKTPKTVPAANKRTRLCKKLSYNEAASVEIITKKLAEISNESEPSKKQVEAVNEGKLRRSPRLVKGSRLVATPTTQTKRRMVISLVISYTREKMDVDALEEGKGNYDMMLKLFQFMSTPKEVKSIYDYNSKKLDGIHKVLCVEGLKSPKVHAVTRAPPVRFRTNFILKDPLGLLSKNIGGSGEHGPMQNQSMYDPSEACHRSSDLAPFLEWYTSGCRDDKIDVPTISVTKEWFDGIWFSERCLFNDHIDALTTLVKIKAMLYREQFLSNWTVLEQLCWGHLSCMNIENVIDYVMPYVRGSYPAIGGIAWHNADKVYGVGHVLGTHWVVYEVLLREQRIIIYDSLSDTGPNAETLAEFYNVARNIPILCRVGDVWKIKGWNLDDLTDVWDLLYYPSPPQQINDYDCGVMCIKFIECLVSNNPLSIIQPTRTRIFRQIFCAQLFTHRNAANLLSH